MYIQTEHMSFSSGIQRHPPQTSLRSLRLGPAPKKKTNSEKILVFGDHHPKASGIQHSVYIYTYVYLFIYSLVYLFIGLFIYLFIYIFILCIYIYTSYIYKLTPAISNQLAVCTSRPHILVLQSPIVHRWTTNFDSKVQFQWLHLTQSLDMFG